MKLIDSHSHIHFDQEFPDVVEVLERARRGGVLGQVIVGCTVEDSLKAAEFVAAHDDLNWTIGVHPHDANKLDQKAKDTILNVLKKDCLSSLAVKKMPVAIGECGLDFYRNLSSLEDQKKAFIWQLETAKQFDLPVIIHVREAFDEAFEILDQINYSKIVFHCFTGGIREAEMAWERSYITSFSGVVTYPKNLELQEVAKKAPENLIIVETDCPFLAPQKYRGKRNEPAFVVETARFIAELRGQTLEDFAEITTANCQRIFKI